MSTKIYFAYRMPTKVFSPIFLPAFRKCVLSSAAKFIKDCMPGITISQLKAEWQTHKKYDKTLTWAKFAAEQSDGCRVKLIFQKMRETTKLVGRRFAEIDCSMNVWICDSKLYTILYGEDWLWKDYKPTDGVEDFCYWNNTDGPQNVSRKKWHARGQTWEKVCLDGDWNAGRMVHDIINTSQEIGLYEVASRILDKANAYRAIWLD